MNRSRRQDPDRALRSRRYRSCRTPTSSVHAPARACLARLHGQAQTESRKDRGQRIKPWVASLGERPIQRLAGEPGFLGERRHTANRIGNRAQRNGYGTRIAIGEHRFQVLRDLSLVS